MNPKFCLGDTFSRAFQFLEGLLGCFCRDEVSHCPEESGIEGLRRLGGLEPGREQDKVAPREMRALFGSHVFVMAHGRGERGKELGAGLNLVVVAQIVDHDESIVDSGP